MRCGAKCRFCPVSALSCGVVCRVPLSPVSGLKMANTSLNNSFTNNCMTGCYRQKVLFYAACRGFFVKLRHFANGKSIAPLSFLPVFKGLSLRFCGPSRCLSLPALSAVPVGGQGGPVGYIMHWSING